MGKRKQLYDLEKNVEYGGIEHPRVNPKARAKFMAKAYGAIHLHSYDTIGYLKAKGHNVKGEMSSGGS